MTQQFWNANQYINHASFVPELGNPILKLLAPVPNETILDLGCGEGTLTEKIAETGAKVYGIDNSESMIDVARKRGLDVEVMSGENLKLQQEFDAVFSNAALHWMTDYQAVIKGVYQCLKPNGRFVGELGGEGNIAALLNVMENLFQKYQDFGEFKNPWFFPSADFYRTALEISGFQVHYLELIPRPTLLKSGVKEWLKIFAAPITQSLTEEQKDKFYQEAEELLKPILYNEQEGWIADYVRLRFVASKIDSSFVD